MPHDMISMLHKCADTAALIAHALSHRVGRSCAAHNTAYLVVLGKTRTEAIVLTIPTQIPDTCTRRGSLDVRIPIKHEVINIQSHMGMIMSGKARGMTYKGISTALIAAQSCEPLPSVSCHY